MSSRSIWFNPSVGVAGDMVLAALIDLGADESTVRSQLAGLPLEGWSLTLERTRRCGLVATSLTVEVPRHDHHRPWSRIDAMLADAPIDPAVADGARRTFELLARAESQVHGIEVDAVHFHEVGAVDAIIDIVGAWAALRSLVDTAEGGGLRVISAPVGLGSGTAAMAHGRVPVPAPAVLELLRGLPCAPVDIDGETATPTGVALLVAMVEAWGPVPAGTLAGSGRGAGSRDPEGYANVLSAVRVDHIGTGAGGGSRLLETNVDDVTPETLAHVIDRALSVGADDAWVTPVTMKKGRPAHQLSVLCSDGTADALREMIAAETGTLGIRELSVDKHELARSTETVELDGHLVRIKVGPHGAKPEHDDVAAASTALGRPLRDVATAALAAWRRRS